MMTKTRRELASTIEVQVLSSMSTKSIRVLPDSGAEITAARKETLAYPDHNLDKLLPSIVLPRAVNGNNITTIDRITIVIHLQGKQYTDDLHIIQGIKSAVISWQAAKCSEILPMQYPNPINNEPATHNND